MAFQSSLLICSGYSIVASVSLSVAGVGGSVGIGSVSCPSRGCIVVGVKDDDDGPCCVAGVVVG